MTIEINGLTFSYGSSERPALRNITLTIPDGSFFGIIGMNEAGKSTLCRALIGFVPHFFTGTWTGEVSINGYSVLKGNIPELANKIGFVFQNPFDQLTGVAETVFEEVAFGLEQRGLPADEILERVNKALSAVGLTSKADRHPFYLSGGQQQRLAVAAVLALKPPILILDEATSQLDPVGTEEVFNLADELHQEGQTILMVEHKLDRLAKHADQIAVLYQGELVLVGDTETVLTHPDLPNWGLRYPSLTDLGIKLKDLGFYSGRLPVTLDQAETMVREVLA
jgi:energy-coupling factor transport system ATP-binding protein